MAQLVLIASPNEALRDRVLRAVAAPGRILREARSGASLQELVSAEVPELLILDTDSPEAGIASVRAIRAQQLGVSILLLTESRSREQVAAVAAALGVHAVLARCGDLAVLVDHVDCVLDERLAKLGLPFDLD